jgi:transcriptional regulator with XRE-family HTH domain
MRRSPQRHTLAILRNIIGLTQSELGKLVHRSGRTIQMIELNRDYRLTPELAEKISYQTHVNLAWLLENDISKPPISQDREPYTKDDYEVAQARICGNASNKSRPEVRIIEFQMSIAALVAKIGATALAAQRSGKFNLFDWKSYQAIDELGREFGVSAKDTGEFLAAWRVSRGETYDLAEFKLDSMMKQLNFRFVAKELDRANLKLNQLHRKVMIAESITNAKEIKRGAS